MADGVDHIDIYADVGEEFNQVRAAGGHGAAPPLLSLPSPAFAACRALSAAAGPGRAAIVRPAPPRGFPAAASERVHLLSPSLCGMGTGRREAEPQARPAGATGARLGWGAPRRPAAVSEGRLLAGRERGRGAPAASAFPPPIPPSASARAGAGTDASPAAGRRRPWRTGPSRMWWGVRLLPGGGGEMLPLFAEE